MSTFVYILKKAVTVFFVFVAAEVLCVGYGFFMLSGGGGCGDDIESTARSPDGSTIATVSWRNCGATTGYATMVSLRRKGTSFDIDGNSNGIVLILGQGDDLALKWASNDKLQVTDSTPDEIRPTDIVKKERMWNLVAINYNFPVRPKLKAGGGH